MCACRCQPARDATRVSTQANTFFARRYDDNSTREITCGLTREAFKEEATHKTGVECSGAIGTLQFVSIVVYIITSLMQLAVAQKLEVMFHARNIKSWWPAQGGPMFQSDRRPDRRGEWAERGELEVASGGGGEVL